MGWTAPGLYHYWTSRFGIRPRAGFGKVTSTTTSREPSSHILSLFAVLLTGLHCPTHSLSRPQEDGPVPTFYCLRNQQQPIALPPFHLCEILPCKSFTRSKNCPNGANDCSHIASMLPAGALQRRKFSEVRSVAFGRTITLDAPQNAMVWE